MKIEELFEMPEFIDKEMPVVMSGTMRFYSEDTIKRDFDSIGKVKVNDEEVWSILKKDKSFAVIGILSVRKEDKKIGLNLIGKLEFKSKPSTEDFFKADQRDKDDVVLSSPSSQNGSPPNPPSKPPSSRMLSEHTHQSTGEPPRVPQTRSKPTTPHGHQSAPISRNPSEPTTPDQRTIAQETLRRTSV